MKQLVSKNKIFEQPIVQYIASVSQALNSYELAYGKSQKDYAEYLSHYLDSEPQAVIEGKQAVNVYRKLYKSNPSLYITDYVEVLENYADYLFYGDQDEQAICIIKKVLSLYRQLIKLDKDKYLIDYADALTSYSNYLIWNNKPVKATGVIQQSLQYFKQRKKYAKDYAICYPRALQMSATIMEKRGVKAAKIIPILQQAMQVFKQAAQPQDESYRARYTCLLYAYASKLAELKDFNQAIAHYQEAIAIYRPLLAIDFYRYAKDFSYILEDYAAAVYQQSCLKNCSDIKSKINTAQLAYGEAIAIKKDLVKAGLVSLVSKLASSLVNYAYFLYDIERLEQALRVAKTAINLLTRYLRQLQLPNELISTNQLALADAFHTYAWLLNRKGKYTESLKPMCIAVLKYEQWDNKKRGVDPYNHIRALRYYSYLLFDNGYMADALVFSSKAMTRLNRWQDKLSSSKHAVLTIETMSHHRECLAANAHYRSALILAKELVTLCEKWSVKDTKKFSSIFLESIIEYGLCLDDNRQYKHAIKQYKKAFIFYQRYLSNNEKSHAMLAWLLNNYSMSLGNLGKLTEALDYIEQAITIRSQLVSQCPDNYLEGLAYSMDHCANLWMMKGDFVKAITYKEQTIKLYKRDQKKLPYHYPALIIYRELEIALLNWLLDDKKNNLVELTVAQMNMETSDKEYINFQQSCTLAFLSVGNQQTHYALKALTYWQAMNHSIEEDDSCYIWLIAALLLQKNEYQLTKQQRSYLKQWPTYLLKFLQRRNNQLPAWLGATANKLNIQLPKIP